MNLTIVSVPFPFDDNELTIKHQHNAIQSWVRLGIPIMLIGDEYGISDAAVDYGVQHVSGIRKNVLGDLSMKSIFGLINKNVTTDWVAYLDTDTILLDDFVPMFEYCSEKWGNCMICAGRWDAKIEYNINFENPHWQRNTKDKVFKLHRKGCDYFVYRRGFYKHIPDFSIGKGAWDGWMLGAAKVKYIPIVDISYICKAIHQWHGHRWSGHPGTDRNRKLCGKTEAWINDSDFILKELQ